jgi:hypothetical protein
MLFKTYFTYTHVVCNKCNIGEILTFTSRLLESPTRQQCCQLNTFSVPILRGKAYWCRQQKHFENHCYTVYLGYTSFPKI